MSFIHITEKSANKKTGPMMVTTSGRDTCPDTCPLKKNGCYADSGPLALHWDKVTKGERGADWATLCTTVGALAEGSIWRHNQAGDLPHRAGIIDSKKMAALILANKGRKGFTYTHHNMASAKNRAIIQTANNAGFTVNLSANNLDHADKLASLECGPVVTVLPEGLPHKLKTPAGRDVITCPATYRENVSCFSCQLCQKQRAAIIGFPVHGTGKKKAARVFMMRQI